MKSEIFLYITEMKLLLSFGFNHIFSLLLQKVIFLSFYSFYRDKLNFKFSLKPIAPKICFGVISNSVKLLIVN